MTKQLPKTYNSKDQEDDIYKKWEDSGYFNPDNLSLDKNSPTYSIVIPPPNVTGTLHMGHAAMLAFQDILVRFYRMNGYRSLWVPGTDHAAIATQAKVENKILEEESKTKYDLGKEEFLKRVEKFASESHKTIQNQIKKMGSSCDWSREVYTLDSVRTKVVRGVFKLMYEDGLIYRGERIVNWCPHCRSTLSDDEVEYKEQTAKLYTFKYNKDFPFFIATTRPETKLGDTAVAVNPEDDRYKDYVGKEFRLKFVGVDLKLKIVADTGIDMEFGTGALGITPSHSTVDWDLAEKHDLEKIKLIDEDGRIRSGFGEFSGLSVLEARKKIVEKLRQEGLLEKEEEIENNLSICYRCDNSIEPLPSLQWFIDVNKKIPKFERSIKEMISLAVKEGVLGRDKINIVPERFEKNYFSWIDNLRDWCISRQIWFGHSIPVWYKGDDIYVGIKDPQEEGWIQEEGTLDTWFSSGLWTFASMAHSLEEIKIEDGKIRIDSDDFRNYHPTSVLETGYDILFFWVARMIIMTTYAVEDIPFQDVYLHGLVLDGEGKKMSKSKGNTIDPLDMVDKYGTDSTRLSLVIGSSPGHDLKISEEKVAGFRNFVNKFWNISRFILGGYEEENLTKQEFFNRATDADLWIWKKTEDLIVEITESIKNYNFSFAGEKLRDFTHHDLADWYLEVSKFENNQEVKSFVLYSVLKDLLKLWHPYIPYVTELIWSHFNKGDLIVADWPEASAYKIGSGQKNGDNFELTKNIISSIRNARALNKVGPDKKVKAVIHAGDKVDVLEANKEVIKGLRTGIKDLEVKKEGPGLSDSIYIVEEGIEVYLLGAVDKEKEKQRITKEIEELQNNIQKKEVKLDNKEFLQKAPEAVVKNEKKKHQELKEELERLRLKRQEMDS